MENEEWGWALDDDVAGLGWHSYVVGTVGGDGGVDRRKRRPQPTQGKTTARWAQTAKTTRPRKKSDAEVKNAGDAESAVHWKPTRRRRARVVDGRRLECSSSVNQQTDRDTVTSITLNDNG